MGMFCSICNMQIQSGSNFCPNCQPQHDSQNAELTQLSYLPESNAQSIVYQAPKNNQNSGLIIGMIVAIILVSGLLTLAIFSFTTSSTGIGVGDRAPNLEGKVYDGNGWEPFDLHERFDETWTDGPGNWVMVHFIDVNCGYCVNAAQDQIPYQQSRWLDGARPLEPGTTVEFVAVAIKLGLQNGDYSESSIPDFRDEYDHSFPYLDDLDNSNRDEWFIQGTPTYFLIAPNGLIAYSGPEQAATENVWDAMEEQIPMG